MEWLGWVTVRVFSPSPSLRPCPLQLETTRAIEEGEELVVSSARETLEQRRKEAGLDSEAATEEEGEAPSPREKQRTGNKAAEAAAEQAAKAAAEADLEEAEGQLQDAMMEQLLASGWRQHTLDVFVQRHAALAATLAQSGGLKSRAAKQLAKERAEALGVYYGDRRRSARIREQAGACDSAALRELLAAQEASLLRHPPPGSTQQLEQRLTLAASQRFVRVESHEPPLQHRSVFKQLQRPTVKKLGGLAGEPQPLPEVRGWASWETGRHPRRALPPRLPARSPRLPASPAPRITLPCLACCAAQGCRDRLDSGDAFPGVHVCEVQARLHSVRCALRMVPLCCRPAQTPLLLLGKVAQPPS